MLDELDNGHGCGGHGFEHRLEELTTQARAAVSLSSFSLGPLLRRQVGRAIVRLLPLASP